MKKKILIGIIVGAVLVAAIIIGAVLLLDENKNGEKGQLEFDLNEDGKSYSVVGLGTYSDTDVVIPDTYKGKPVTKIADEAFFGNECAKITSITIPDSVTSIGDEAFQGCSSLTSIEIPDSVESIGRWAFHCCTSLTSIEIPDSVTSIGGRTFFGCSSLTSITIPDSVTSIGEGAFSDCRSLTSIYVDKNNEHYKSINGNLYSKDGKNLIQYAIGKKGTAFSIPDSVTSISDDAFSGCRSLTSIEIPDSVTSIGWGAFDGCSSLTSIEIPDAVTSIGGWAFCECTSLTSITIPDSVTSIGNDAFWGCSSLTIYCEAESKPRGWHDNWKPSNCPVVWGYIGE